MEGESTWTAVKLKSLCHILLITKAELFSAIMENQEKGLQATSLSEWGSQTESLPRVFIRRWC